MRIIAFFVIPVMLLTGCSGAGSSPTAVPTLNLDQVSPVTESSSETLQAIAGVTASGILVPIRESKIGSNTINQVDAVLVSLGDQVKQGEILATLGGREGVEAALAAAEAAAISTQSDFDNWVQEAPIRYAQFEKDIVIAQEAYNEALRLQKSLKYQRWLFTTKTEKQIQRIEKEQETKFGNPTNEALEKAEIDLKLKEAELIELKRKLSTFIDGIDPIELSQRKAFLESMQKQVSGMKEQLAALDVKAPFDGVVSKVNIHVGDMVNPGQVLFIVTDDTTLQVETTDLSERDTPQVKTGMRVSVRIKPLGVSVAGTVKAISAKAETIGGDVVYTAVIELEEIPENVRAGMTVEVTF